MRWRRLVITAAIVLGAALVTQAGPSPAGASTLPTGFRDSVVLSGLTNPTVLQFAPDGRIFVGQKNGVIKVFQSLTDTNPVTVADLSSKVDDYWDRGLLGMALAAELPDRPVRLRALRVRRPDRRHRADLERRLPDPARPDHRRLPGVGAPVATADQRERHDRQRAGAHQRLVPAVPQPLDRHAPVRPRRVPLRHRRRRRQLQQRRLRAVRRDLRRRPGKPLRRPARCGRHGAEPTRCRGRRAAQPERPAHRRPGNARRRGPADRPGHRRGRARQPLLLLTGCQRAPDRGLRAAQPVPHHPTPRDRRAVDRRCRLEHLGRDQPRRRTRQRHGVELRLAVLRGSLTARRLPGCRPQPVLVAVLDAWFGHRAVLRVQPQRVRGELHRLPHGRLIDHRRGVLPGRVVPGAVQRRAVLRRPQPQRDLGDAPGHERVARPRPGCSRSSASTRRAVPPGIRST